MQPRINLVKVFSLPALNRSEEAQRRADEARVRFWDDDDRISRLSLRCFCGTSFSSTVGNGPTKKHVEPTAKSTPIHHVSRRGAPRALAAPAVAFTWEREA